ncbi:DUF3316 domain-containing protein [Psychromonas sp. PT13]|uniref:DUF3316 domain-containing protein n=1 Tax=Psychromonas sp. PT13 TaxID=3439547 RepID=UPI003EBE2C57
MKKLIAITAGILLSSSVLASTTTLHRNANIESANFATKAEAINAGFDIVDDLSALNKNELRKELPVFTTGFARNLSVNDTEVKTQEFALDRGEIQYRAIVKVNYSFDTQDND